MAFIIGKGQYFFSSGGMYINGVGVYVSLCWEEYVSLCSPISLKLAKLCCDATVLAPPCVEFWRLR
jgi:hypothetical protein